MPFYLILTVVSILYGYSIYTVYCRIYTVVFLHSINCMLLTLIVVMVLWLYTYIKTYLIIYFKYVRFVAHLSKAVYHTYTFWQLKKLPSLGGMLSSGVVQLWFLFFCLFDLGFGLYVSVFSRCLSISIDQGKSQWSSV